MQFELTVCVSFGPCALSRCETNPETVDSLEMPTFEVDEEALQSACR